MNTIVPPPPPPPPSSPPPPSPPPTTTETTTPRQPPTALSPKRQVLWKKTFMLKKFNHNRIIKMLAKVLRRNEEKRLLVFE